MNLPPATEETHVLATLASAGQGSTRSQVRKDDQTIDLCFVGKCPQADVGQNVFGAGGPRGPRHLRPGPARAERSPTPPTANGRTPHRPVRPKDDARASPRWRGSVRWLGRRERPAPTGLFAEGRLASVVERSQAGPRQESGGCPRRGSRSGPARGESDRPDSVGPQEVVCRSPA